MRQLARYAFANARVRALLSQLLDEAAWRRLLEARDLQEVLSLLQSTPYGRILASFTGVKEELVGLERTLKRQDIALHRKLARSVSGEKEKSLILLLCQRYEVEELKTALRLWHGKPAVEPER
ncbi:MAG TPA: V-type ATPase subunit, partial [bacterium]|nr:V-type ATPase subunit [bacterium]